MEYKYLENIFSKDDIILPNSSKIDKCLLKNHYAEAVKAIDFFNTEGKLLYVHGFLGTGKRQFINYISDFLSNDVIVLEYYCKASTVCDDILLSFIDTIEKISLSKAVNHTAKIATLAVKFQQYVSSIKKPFVIILHSFDDILEDNKALIVSCMKNTLQNSNTKLVLSTRAMIQNILDDVKIDRKIFLKALTKDIFKELISEYSINYTDDSIEDFYKYSRGYYYYTILALKIIKSMDISLNDFLAKFSLSGMTFDAYLGFTYVNLIPNTIRNFFWFLRTIRHGISLNALAILGIQDEFALEYLRTNLMIFISKEIVFVQDYFQQDIDISIPAKTEIKLHKYIISIYEKELKESLQKREILISRQALRAEIEYHNRRIYDLENSDNNKNEETESLNKEFDNAQQNKSVQEKPKRIEPDNITIEMDNAKKLADDKKYTEAIEAYLKIIDDNKADENSISEIRVHLGRLYREINELNKAQHYFELAEKYYKKKEEYINLNYLYYELTGLYFDMYKIDRAIETIKKVIYSVDTPQSLMVDACTLLGNIYSDSDNSDEASKYYQKALESVDETVQQENLSELYFKYALMCDENGDTAKAFEYYNKCISSNENSPYKSPAYSNMGSCYFENDNYSDAEACFLKSYQIEKDNNNYEGIFYSATYLAKIYLKISPQKALDYLIEAKQSAEFINDDFYIIESSIALGDYYYDHIDMAEKAATEYFSALKIGKNHGDMVDLKKIEERIQDMKLRLSTEVFEKIEKKYEKS